MIKSLYEPFQKWGRTGGIWVYSDPHFNDKDNVFMRGGSYPGDEEQVERINSKVGTDDTIIILGDIGDAGYVERIRGRKVLVKGNHDRGSANYKKRTSYIEFDSVDEAEEARRRGIIDYVCLDFHGKVRGGKSNRLFDEVYDGILAISGKVILSHEPLPDINYALNIHGHDHSGKSCRDGFHLNVCAELVGYEPLNLKWIMEKSGMVGKIPSIHRLAIDRQAENSRLRKETEWKRKK